MLRPEQNGKYFADNIFKHISLKANICILIQISEKFVPHSFGSGNDFAPDRGQAIIWINADSISLTCLNGMFWTLKFSLSIENISIHPMTNCLGGINCIS